MVSKVSRSKVREEKHRRMRRHIIGTPERPRMAVFRSNNHMYVQIIDDVAQTTLVSASTLQKDVKEKLEKTNDVAAAAYLGTVIAKKAQEAGIKSVVFDRGGFIYQFSTVCGFIYQYFWLMRQLKNGFSASRTVRNYFAKSSTYSQESILIIFMLVLLTSAFLGKFAMVFGITSTLLYCYAFPQLIIEVVYLLYLKTQSKEYWETEPDGEVSFRNLFRNLFKEFSLKKAKIRIPLEIFLLLLIIYIDGGNAYINVFINQTRWLLLLIRIFIISIGLDILGSFILYVIKKVNTRFKKGKKK